MQLSCLAFAIFAQADKTAGPTPDQVAGAAGFTIVTLLGFACLGVVGLLFYFLPVFVAGMRKHQNTAAIAVLTLFLGWTFIGWIAALVWSFTEVQQQPARRSRRDDYDR